MRPRSARPRSARFADVASGALAAAALAACAPTGAPAPTATPSAQRATSSSSTATYSPTPTPRPPAGFASSIAPIDAALATRMTTSWREGCPVPLEGLRYLTMTYRGFDGAERGAVGLAVALAVTRRRGRRLPMAAPDAIAPMLPTTRRGRWGWARLSVTAGVTEEVTYRGLLVLVAAMLLPDLPRPALIAVVAGCFGLAHTYQGRRGMLATGLAGAVFAGLYLASGSLLLPMVLHTLVDLRALLLSPREAPAARPAAAAVPAA